MRPGMPLDCRTFDSSEQVLLQVALAYAPDRVAVVGKNVEVASSLSSWEESKPTECKRFPIPKTEVGRNRPPHRKREPCPLRQTGWLRARFHGALRFLARPTLPMHFRRADKNESDPDQEHVPQKQHDHRQRRFFPIGDAVLIVIPVKMDLNIHPPKFPSTQIKSWDWVELFQSP